MADQHATHANLNAAVPFSAPSEAPTRNAPAVWWLVACLLVIGILAQIDKTIITLLVPSIKRDLSLSDTEIGLIIGAAFALANLGIGIPAGWFADRFSRRGVIAAGVVIWSVATACCGAANSFWLLFVARAGCGLGEGMSPPASYSLIRDSAKPARRGSAFSVFGMYMSFGAGLSLVLGGALIGLIVTSGWHTFPVFGVVKPWQMALIIVGICGLPMCVLAYAFRDPGRAPQEAASTGSFGEAFAHLRVNWLPALLLLVFSVTHAMLTSSLAAWLPTFIGRNFGLQPQVIGPTLGALLMVAAPVGLMAAGLMMDRSARSGPGAIAIVAIAVAAVLLISSALLPSSATLTTFWILETFVILTSTTYMPVTSAMVTELVPSRAVGKTMAGFLIIQGACGTGAAPVIAALVSDHLYAGRPGALGQALGLVMTIYGFIALLAAAGLFFAVNGHRSANTSLPKRPKLGSSAHTAAP